MGFALLPTVSSSGSLNAVRPRVLIVDDDPAFRKTAGELLRARGFAVVGEASDYREALAAASDLEPDGMLVDVHLPEVDGFEIAAALSRRPRGPLVLLTSSDDQAATHQLAKQRGAQGFIPKTDLATADLRRYLGE